MKDSLMITRNVLHYAASTDLQIVQYLVDKTISVDVQDNEGW